MSPDTVHFIAQEIRHKRALLTCEEKWARAMPYSEQKKETFKRINFWREQLDDAERKIASGSTRQIGAATG